MAGHWVYGAASGGSPPAGCRRSAGAGARPATAATATATSGMGRRPRSATVLVAVPDPVGADDAGLGGHGRASAGPTWSCPAAGSSSDELYAVKCALQQPPRAHGFASDRWTLRRVAQVVERATGVRGWQPTELQALLETLDLDLRLRDQPRDQRDHRDTRWSMVS